MDNPDIPTTLGIHDTGRKQKTNKNKEKKTNKTTNKGRHWCSRRLNSHVLNILQ